MKLALLVSGILVTSVAHVPPVTLTCTIPRDFLKLSTAPAGETPFQRWKRTKADYESASKATEQLRDQVASLDLPAYAAWKDAEKALQNTKCDALCRPVTK